MILFLFSAQHISQPPDVTNNAKSSRQADRVGRGVPSVRVAGNVGMDTDCKFVPENVKLLTTIYCIKHCVKIVYMGHKQIHKSC